MSQFEYKVVPAPAKGLKARGIKSPEARFANTLEGVMNTMGAQGWEYQRAETLPSQERSGLTGSVTKYRNVLVFRRASSSDISAFQPVVLDVVAVNNVEPTENIATNARNSTETGKIEPPLTAAPDTGSDPERPAGQPGATNMLKDNGVEEPSDVAGMTQALKERAAQKTGV